MIHLGDVATIGDGVKQTQAIDRLNGVPAVALVVTKTATANTLAVSAGVRAAMARLGPTLPEGMRLDIVSDAATYTQQSFDTIRKTLIEAIILTGLILLLFLHTPRGTLIVLISIPTSVLTTFALMNVMGMNLNLFSMLALTLSVGILVDDSIVVLENIYRHLGMGEPPFVATLSGRREIGLAALTITMVDVVVYVPIALISGIAGDFIRPFALVIAAATLTSLAVSFTLTPLLASRFLTMEHTRAPGHGCARTLWTRLESRVRLARAVGTSGLLRRTLISTLIPLGFVRVGLLRATGGRFGRRAPGRVGMRWGAILAGFLAAMAGVALLGAGLIGLDIFPSGDQSEIDVQLIMPSATSIADTYAVVQGIEQKLKTVPEVREVFSITGGGASSFGVASGDTSQIRILLVPKGERTRSSAQIADELTNTLPPRIPKSRLSVSLPNAFGFGGFGGQPIQVAIQGPDPETLNRLVDQATALMARRPWRGRREQREPEGPARVRARIGPRARGRSRRFSAAGVDALHIAVDGLVVSKFRQLGQDDVDIRLISDDAFRASPANLPDLPILQRGALVRLGQLGTIVPGSAATVITHVGRVRSVNISASTNGRLVGDVLGDMQTRLDGMALPPGYTITYSGQAAQGGSAFSDIFKALGVAVLLMYLLMLMLFKSVTLPLAVLMSLPLAIVGALGAMALTGSPFTLFSLLGIAVLVGLVGKNAILLVDYTDTLRKRGIGRTEALLEAAPTRLRPILMTTFSIIASLTPVGLGLEEGSELLKSAAVVLIGGLLTSTLLTLVFVPAMYTILDDFQELVLGLVGRIAKPRQLQAEELAILRPGPSP